MSSRAGRVVSSPGSHDGLYWPSESGQQSPLGPLFAQASSEGYRIPAASERPGEPKPYYGYLYRVLPSQSAGSYGLVATPANYGVSGIMTFIVNQNGTVFEKDLGPQSASRAAAITAFNPEGWRRAQ